METVLLKIKRQDDPGDLPYWEEFVVAWKKGMTVADALSSICEEPVTAEGNPTSPVAHEASCLKGVCGACAMVINGKVRLACRTFLEELDAPVALEPMEKFPVLRDLKTDRDRLFDALANMRAWTDVDGVSGSGVFSAMAPVDADRLHEFSRCIMCGACLVACPQVCDRANFVGAFVFGRLVSLNAHPSGRLSVGQRLDALMEPDGIAECAHAGACDDVCPRNVPLSDAASRLGMATSIRSIKRLFWG